MGLAAFAVAALATGLATGWADAQPLSTVALGLGYVAGLYGSGTVLDGRAPLFAAGLLLSAELAHWSQELARWPGEVRATAARRALLVGGLVIASAAAGALLLITSAVTSPAGLGAAATGVLAAAAALGLIALLARRIA
ncbi:MAG: hypothetical protein ACREPA_06750 [Candidatus Dormibacteraceae bacterium]